MQEAFNAISTVPAEVWTTIGAAIGVSAILEGIKKTLSLESDKVITTLLGTLAFAASAIDFLLAATAYNPAILGAQTATIVGLATFIYRFVVKPASTFMTEVKDYKRRKATVTLPTATVTAPLAAIETGAVTTSPAFEETADKPYDF